MRVRFTGIGIWAPGMTTWSEFCERETSVEVPAFETPKPEAIPATERRRAPLIVKLAIEVAHQACVNSGVDGKTVPTVFASAMGDSQITDYMCRALAAESKVLSPTKFHNSVHNAPAGYWSISSQNRSPSSSVASSRESFPAALLESAVQATNRGGPVLLIVTDISIPPPLGNVYPIEEGFGMALMVEPEGASGDHDNSRRDFWELSLDPAKQRKAWPAARDPRLQNLAGRNPGGRSLPLLEMIAAADFESIAWPLNDRLSLQLTPAQSA